MSKPLTTAIIDLGHAAVSLGNHVSRTPVSPTDSWEERLEYAAREADRLALEFRALASDARDFARRIA